MPTYPSSPSDPLYLGDFVKITSSTVDLGNSKLKSVMDATDDQDVVSYKQVKSLKVLTDEAISKNASDITDVNSRIDTLVNGSGSYDSLKKVVELLSSVDATNDAELVSSVFTLNAAVVTEKDRAIAKENSIDADLQAAKALELQHKSSTDATIANIISTYTANKTATDAAIANEVSARTEADTVQKSLMITSINVSPNPSIFADAEQPVMPDANTTDGWKFTNLTSGRKVNWYMQPTAGLKYKDLNHLSMNCWITSNVQLPYLVIYTKRKNDGNDKASWYRSKAAYEIATPTTIMPNSTLNSVPYQFYRKCSAVDTSTLPNYNYQQKELAVTNVVSSIVGQIDPEDEILFVAISSNSAAPVGSVNFNVSSFCYATKSGTFETNFSSSSLVATSSAISVAAEQARAMAAESCLRTDLNTLSTKQESDVATFQGTVTAFNTTLSASIGAEKARAETAEGVIANDLSAHKTAYVTDKTNIQSAIASLQSALTTELSTRSAADTALQTELENVKSSLLSLANSFYGINKYTATPFSVPYAHQ